jgi:hypothetical protein
MVMRLVLTGMAYDNDMFSTDMPSRWVTDMSSSTDISSLRDWF